MKTIGLVVVLGVLVTVTWFVTRSGQTEPLDTQRAESEASSTALPRDSSSPAASAAPDVQRRPSLVIADAGVVDEELVEEPRALGVAGIPLPDLGRGNPYAAIDLTKSEADMLAESVTVHHQTVMEMADQLERGIITEEEYEKAVLDSLRATGSAIEDELGVQRTEVLAEELEMYSKDLAKELANREKTRTGYRSPKSDEKAGSMGSAGPP